MEIKAQLNYLRMAPRKVRLVANLIKGMEAKRAELELIHLPRRASGPMLKLLKSAVTNAKNNFQLDERGLYVKNVQVNEGPTLKRLRPRAFGRAATIRKRTSHVVLVLEGRVAPDKEKIKKKEGPLVREVLPEDKHEQTRTATEARTDAKRKSGKIGPRIRPSRPADFVRRIFRRKAI